MNIKGEKKAEAYDDSETNSEQCLPVGNGKDADGKILEAADARDRRLMLLRARIQAGTYNVSSLALADSLMRRMLRTS